MADKTPTAPGRALASFLTRERIDELARALGVLKRERKVDLTSLVWTLTLAFQVGTSRTIEGLRVAYQRVAGHTIARSAFYTRLTASLAELLRRLAQEGIDRLGASPTAPGGFLKGFKELLAIDSTVIGLHDLLASDFPGCRTNHTKAAAKLHMVMNAADGSPRHLRLTPERTADTTPWQRVGKWLSGSLILFDLGYYSFHLFDRIDQNGGYFLTRLKSNANPTIRGANRVWRGRAVELEGRKLQTVLKEIQRDVLDVEAEVAFKGRAYRRVRRIRRRPFRLIGIRNAETGNYHLYITNVPPERLSAEDITRTYALRWQVELLFKAMKQHGNLDQLPSSNRPVVECLIWASVLSSLASQVVCRLVKTKLTDGRHIPPLRWAALFSRNALALLSVTLKLDSREDHALDLLLIKEAPDPNLRRKSPVQTRVLC